MTNNKEMIEVQEQSKSQTSINEVLENEISFAPLVDIYESENDYTLAASMPGVAKENVQLKVEEDSLLIFGKINIDEAAGRKYILNENEIGNYFRRFKLSESIDVSKITAEYKNGQLLVALPKHERVKPRKIEIK